MFRLFQAPLAMIRCHFCGRTLQMLRGCVFHCTETNHAVSSGVRVLPAGRHFVYMHNLSLTYIGSTMPLRRLLMPTQPLCLILSVLCHFAQTDFRLCSALVKETSRLFSE